MALETPAWLNKAFVEKVLESSGEHDLVQITDIHVTPATNKGDNYTSDMLRIHIEYFKKGGDEAHVEKMSIVVKISPQKDGVQRSLVLAAGLFDVEIKMMTDTLQKMNDIIGSLGRFSGKGLYVQREEPVLLVMEDLKPLGYRMACRQSGLDMNHTLLAINNLAKFHAASVAVCEKEPEQKKHYVRGMFSDLNPPEMGFFFNSSVKCLADEVANWTDAVQYEPKIREISTHIYDIATKASAMKEDEFNVINHGDFWVNNMLFRYDDNEKVVNHIMVDFQMCIYSSPAVDLLYFFGTSMSDEIYFNYKDRVLEEYQKTLASTMVDLGCKTSPPSLADLQKAMKERAAYEMIASFTVLPVVLVDKSEAKDIDEMLSLDGMMDNPGLKGKLFHKTMVKRLPLYDAAGLLNL